MGSVGEWEQGLVGVETDSSSMDGELIVHKMRQQVVCETYRKGMTLYQKGCGRQQQLVGG
eukprot:1159489-Pelagomonas_calceolata.AAC.3